jgi:murein DD-endopeptidase MepM/ murein hydrolase activator NlpD
MIGILLLTGFWSAGNTVGRAAAPQAPFSLPFSAPPGPSTWLLTQAYGNTVTAYRWRKTIYQAGQGLHFGIDLAARCGQPILAIGAGTIAEIDTHGAGPHSLLIDHPNGYASFYGHLLERVTLPIGSPVQLGQPIAKVGDPDGTCFSRPHLHLEIRNAGIYNEAYNPIPLINANWDAIALQSPFGFSFERDLQNPHRWQTLSDQPETHFGQALWNDYQQAWPPNWLP